MRARAGVFAAGPNGLNLVKRVEDYVDVAFICTYAQSGVDSNIYQKTTAIAKSNGWSVLSRHALDSAPVDRCDLLLVAGWQYLFESYDARFVVFHDSLLPRYRGFAPTVTSLIKGEPQLGVTAFAMSDGTDTGNIIASSAIDVTYPCTLREAYSRLEAATSQCIAGAVSAWYSGNLHGTPQDEALATYSVWRDESDMFIDWTRSSSYIRRFVDALGAPLSGARTRYNGQLCYVDEVSEASDVCIEDRVPGKTFSINEHKPTVICGEGLIRIERARDVHGAPFAFSRLRRRFT